MIALDTSVLVRFLVEDDPEQSRRAARFVEKAAKDGETIWLSDVVLVETAWVLDRSYGYPRSEIVDALRRVVSARNVKTAEQDGVVRAVDGYEAGEGGFADCLIRERARESGCDAVVTFDRKLLGREGFRAP